MLKKHFEILIFIFLNIVFLLIFINCDYSGDPSQEENIGEVAKPLFYPDSGIYVTVNQYANVDSGESGVIYIEIKCDTPNVNLRYTINGEEPTEESGEIYTGPIELNKNKIWPIEFNIKAIAYEDGMKSSSNEALWKFTRYHAGAWISMTPGDWWREY